MTGLITANSDKAKAWKELMPDGEWRIHFDPIKKMGYIRWETVSGYIDESNATRIVNLLNGLSPLKLALIDKLSDMFDSDYDDVAIDELHSWLSEQK